MYKLLYMKTLFFTLLVFLINSEVKATNPSFSVHFFAAQIQLLKASIVHNSNYTVVGQAGVLTCNESILYAAGDNARIYEVNLSTGVSSIATTSPYTTGNLNALAANPDAGIVYYGINKTIYYWNPITDVHGTLINLSGQVNANESITSGGGAYYNGYLYMGFEDATYLDYPNVYRIPLTADGLSTSGSAVDLNVPIFWNTSWGDMIVSPDGGNTAIYGGVAYNGSGTTSLYFKYVIETGSYTEINTNMPLELQIGADISSNLWGAGLAIGIIQQFDKATGNFFGNSIDIGANIWDLTGPINCPQLGQSLDPDVCYIISDGIGGGDMLDTFYTINHQTGLVTAVGPLGTFNVETMALNPASGTIYVAERDSFGTIDVNTGAFSLINGDMGNIDGAEGVENINDIDGMTYDSINNIIWVTERKSGENGDSYLPDDILFQINPATGLPIQDAFGAGIDYLTIFTDEDDIDDIAIAPDGTLYAISNRGGTGNQKLGIINKTTGVFSAIGDYGVDDVEGLTFTSAGQLIATTGKSGDHRNQFYSIDPITGEAIFISDLQIAFDVEACACRHSNFANSLIGDFVWSDVDQDGLQDVGEPGVEGVVINLLDSGGSAIMRDGNPLSTTTDANGYYQFAGLPIGDYIVEFLAPSGSSFTDQGIGGVDSLDSDANLATGRSGIISITYVGQFEKTVDAGLKNVTCPTIATTDELNINICDGSDVTFNVVTDASNPPYSYIEFYRFEIQQTNPYTSSDPKVWLDEFPNDTGSGSITSNDFPLNGNASMTYYVYGCVKPEPTDPTTCFPLIEYIVTVTGCNEICDDGIDNDGDGRADALDLDCSGYCGANGTFLSYGMHELRNTTPGSGFYSEHFDLTFDLAGSTYLYWLSGDTFYIKGNVIAYSPTGYVGQYKLYYEATGATYATFEGDNILGATGGSGILVSREPALTQYDNITMGAIPNAAGWSLMVRENSANDISLEGNWGQVGWMGLSLWDVSVLVENCEEPKEICGNGEDDDNDGIPDCIDPDCTNPSDPGTIMGDETNCGTYNPMEITINIAPTGGGNGLLEYQWEQSSDNSNWTEVSGAIQATFDPTNISQTTYYRRKTRRGDCNLWLYTNVITKTVTPPPFIAEIATAPMGANGYLCEGESYLFEAADAGASAFYSWNFGPYASPPTAEGIGPHSVVFTPLTDSLPIYPEVVLSVIEGLCVDVDSASFSLHPLGVITDVNASDPTTCGASDGSLSITAKGEKGLCVAVSLDGGATYQPDGQLDFMGLSAGSYELVIRYCNNDCPNVYGNVSLSDPSGVSLLNDDFVNICPGFDYTSNVFFNDDISSTTTTLSVVADPLYGTVALGNDGEFTYSPSTPTCDIDQFSYQVCDNTTNCCATAVVTLDFEDNSAPDLLNVPDDLTINCDEEIPLPPLVSAFDNCPAISIDKQEKSTQGEDGCSLYDYSITYTWTASDFCGNQSVDSQLVDIVDITAPDIYRVYTLPNGKKLVGGVMENVTHRWKTINLPVEFKNLPVIFSQVATTNQTAPIVVRLRNISVNQFELKLQEEDANDGEVAGESVAWFAMETGTQSIDYQWEAAIYQVGDAIKNIAFQQAFSQTPAFFCNMQTIMDSDPASPRYDGLNSNGVNVKIEEEASVEADLSHINEQLACLAIDAPVLTDDKGAVFGETGTLSIDNNWTTVNLFNAYANPVVIANSLSQNDADPAIIQVRNATPSSFEVRVKEWDYLDGSHSNEQVSYLVIEGSIPLDGSKICDFGTDSLVFGVDIVAVDNCDQNVILNYSEIEAYQGARKIITRTWSATDECGNTETYSREVICEGVLLRLKGILQGAMINSQEDHLMRDDLRKKGLLPLTEPYSDNLNFKHFGQGGGETMDVSMMSKTGSDACVDWVFIELRAANNADSVVATCAGLIQRDGDVMTASGDTLIHFGNVLPGDYFVSLKHRNHLQLVSLNAYTFTPNTIPFVDFTYNFTPVQGNYPSIDMEGTKAMWAGDINVDNRVIYQGPQNDVFFMFLHIIIDDKNTNYLTNYISSGYTDNDFNMDGTVIFQGPNNDKSVLLFNTTLKHPDNHGNFSNFIIMTNNQ